MFGSRLIFGSHFPFQFTQIKDARARGKYEGFRDSVP
jgi:hypothetical protein